MRRQGGFVLLSVLVFAAALVLLLNALAVRASFAGRDAEARAGREAALHEAWGGLRRAAALGGPFERKDEEGRLLVEQAGERLVATFTASGGASARVSALWRDGRLSAWEED